MIDGIRATGVSIERGGRTVVEDVSFAAMRGRVTAILGPNGAGKSSVLKAIAGILPFNGEILVEGADVAQLAPGERAALLAYLPQVSSLRAPLAVRDVVALGRYARERAGESSVTRQEAVDRALRKTKMFDLANQRYTELSGGEQRRVLLARALASGANQLLLDEPTASLDISHALTLFATCRELAAEGKAVVMVLHQLADALQFADHVVLLHRGRLIAAGDTQDVLIRTRVREVYQVQMIPTSAPSFELVDDSAITAHSARGET